MVNNTLIKSQFTFLLIINFILFFLFFQNLGSQLFGKEDEDEDTAMVQTEDEDGKKNLRNTSFNIKEFLYKTKPCLLNAKLTNNRTYLSFCNLENELENLRKEGRELAHLRQLLGQPSFSRNVFEKVIMYFLKSKTVVVVLLLLLLL